MSKKVAISLAIALCVVAVSLILCWTLFGLSSVTVEFHSTTMNLAQTEEQREELEKEIVQAGNFKMGCSVLFEGKNKYVRAIDEAAKDNPKLAYLRVLNIETVFPNKFVVHVAEREELFAVKTAVAIETNSGANHDVNDGSVNGAEVDGVQGETSGMARRAESGTYGAANGAAADIDESGGLENYLICDRDFRVLNVLSQEQWQQTQSEYEQQNVVEEKNGEQDIANEENQENLANQTNHAEQKCLPLLVEGLEIENESVRIGRFLKIGQAAMKNFYSAMLQNNRDLQEILGKFSSITLGKNTDDFTQQEFDCITLHTRAGRKFVINNIDFALANKVQLMFAVESALYSSVDENGVVTNNGQPVELMENEQGQLVVWDENEDNPKIELTVDILAKCYVLVDNLTLSPYVSRSETDIYYCLVRE